MPRNTAYDGKRLFETLAAAVADSDDQDIHARRAIAHNIADALTGVSDRFDPILWLRLCNIGPVEPADVAEWSTRLDMRIRALSAKRRAYAKIHGEATAEIYL